MHSETWLVNAYCYCISASTAAKNCLTNPIFYLLGDLIQNRNGRKIQSRYNKTSNELQLLFVTSHFLTRIFFSKKYFATESTFSPISFHLCFQRLGFKVKFKFYQVHAASYVCNMYECTYFFNLEIKR